MIVGEGSCVPKIGPSCKTPIENRDDDISRCLNLSCLVKVVGPVAQKTVRGILHGTFRQPFRSSWAACRSQRLQADILCPYRTQLVRNSPFVFTPLISRSNVFAIHCSSSSTRMQSLRILSHSRPWAGYGSMPWPNNAGNNALAMTQDPGFSLNASMHTNFPSHSYVILHLLITCGGKSIQYGLYLMSRNHQG